MVFKSYKALRYCAENSEFFCMLPFAKNRITEHPSNLGLSHHAHEKNKLISPRKLQPCPKQIEPIPEGPQIATLT